MNLRIRIPETNKLRQAYEMKSLSPLVKVVRDGLKRDIFSSPAGTEYILPSERNIGIRFGVSRTIVRSAVQSLADEGLLELQEGCRRVANTPSSRKITPGITPEIAVWLWPFTEDFIKRTVMKGIQRAVIGEDVQILMGTTHGDTWDDIMASELDFLKSLLDNESVIGAVIWLLGGTDRLPVLQALRDKGINTVFVDRMAPDGFEANFVGTDNYIATYSAVSHLIQLGHKHIVCYSNLDTAHTVDERIQGYLRALKENNLPHQVVASPHPSLVPYKDGCRMVIQELLRQEEKPTAIFAVNDLEALRIVDILKELKVSIPGEISVVGFDGVHRQLPGGGFLTSACQDFARIGEIAIQRILSNSRSLTPQKTPRHVLLDAPLTLNASTGHPRAG